MSDALEFPDFGDVVAAAARIAPHAHRTPVLRCRSLDQRSGAELYFKCENLQRVGAFKFRGACNTVLQLNEDEARRGVVTHSSGNHAQALACAAALRGIPAHIVMPENAPEVKRAAVADYGGSIRLCEATLEARERSCAELIEEHGATLVHPYDDVRIIAGQGTAALELSDEVPDLDLLLVPVGGGGLAAGSCLVAAERGFRVHGAEPSGADDAARSLETGELVPSVDPETIADGLRTSLGERNFALLRAHDVAITRVDDEATIRAMELVWQRMKLVIEPSAAVPVAAALSGAFAGRRVGVLLSGGNVPLAWRAS